MQLDYADLSERLDWALTHDAEAHSIAEQAAVVARLHLRLEDVECYWCALAACLPIGALAGCVPKGVLAPWRGAATLTCCGARVRAGCGC